MPNGPPRRGLVRSGVFEGRGLDAKAKAERVIYQQSQDGVPNLEVVGVPNITSTAPGWDYKPSLKVTAGK